MISKVFNLLTVRTLFFVSWMSRISGGGKTSITCEMEKNMKSVFVIHMDDYYQVVLINNYVHYCTVFQ